MGHYSNHITNSAVGGLITSVHLPNWMKWGNDYDYPNLGVMGHYSNHITNSVVGVQHSQEETVDVCCLSLHAWAEKCIYKGCGFVYLNICSYPVTEAM